MFTHFQKMDRGLQKKLKWDFSHPLPFQLNSDQIPYNQKLSQHGFLHARHRSPYTSDSLQNLFYIAAINFRSESNSIPRCPKSTQHQFPEDGSWIAKKIKFDFSNSFPFQVRSIQIPYLPKSSQQGFLHARHRSPYKSNSLPNLFILQR